MDNPLISVIVPVYNVEKYLDRCIESIVKQTYTNLEIILVDDGSPDNCPSMCDAWAEKDSRIKVIHKENGGVSSARNAGLDNARGDFVAFVDSDDYVDCNMYETMINYAVCLNLDIVECSICREGPNGKIEVWDFKDKCATISRDDLLIEISSTLNLLCIHSCNKVYSNSVIGEKRYDTTLKYCEDVLFNYEVALDCECKGLIDQPFYHFYYNLESATKNRNPNYKFDEQTVVDKIYRLSPDYLIEYAIKGDVLKTINKIKEVVVDNTANCKELKWLRDRIVSKKTFVFSKDYYSEITKLKVLLIYLFPSVYYLMIKIYGKRQAKKEIDRYLK